MKHRFIFVCVILISLAVSSCTERRKVKAQMTGFLKTMIVIPDDLECICSRETKMIDLESLNGNKFIFYYDSLDCSSCRIGHLSENYPLYEMSDTAGFSVLTIFSPRADELEEVRLKLMKANYSFPVFVDVNGSFSENNGNIPSDRRFHSFLIDSGRHPVYVGNPMSSDRMFELFVRAIDML